MDISLAQHLIFDFLSSGHDSYNSKRDYKLLNWRVLGDDKPDEDECQLAINCCLEEMAQEGFVRKTEKGVGKNKETIYIIVNSLKNMPVTVEISRQTNDNIKRVSQNLLPLISLDIEVNPDDRDVDENDLVLILEAVSLLSQNLQQEIEKNKSLPKTSSNNNELTGGI